jgi:hypothetical protein
MFGDNGAFFNQQARRRIGARRPMAGLGASGAAPMAPSGGQMPPRPMPPPPMAPPSMPSGGMPPPAASGGTSMNGLDPGGMMFMGLPQGSEEAFGAAPAGFNSTLRRPARPNPGPMGGGFMF